MQISTQRFVFVMIVMAGLGAGAATGMVVNPRSPSEVPAPIATATDNFLYFPAQYTLNASNEASELIQTF